MVEHLPNKPKAVSSTPSTAKKKKKKEKKKSNSANIEGMIEVE
jgi:hypothetical protein